MGNKSSQPENAEEEISKKINEYQSLESHYDESFGEIKILPTETKNYGIKLETY